jgi:hypothetical protein
MPSIKDFAVFHQDLAYGIPPIIELGDILNVPTPMFRMIADVSKLVTGVDYMKEGLNIKKLGIKGMTKARLMRYLKTGKK